MNNILIKTDSIFKNGFVVLALFSFLFSVPASAYGQVDTTNFQPKNQLELIAYLQGVLDALQAQINVQDNSGGDVTSRAETKSAKVEVKTTVELSSSFKFSGQTYVNAWFEYGEGSSLNKSTAKTKITESRNEVEHTETLNSLKSGTAYVYRAVYESPSGTKFYGLNKTFNTTTSTSDSSSIGSGNSNNSSSNSTSGTTVSNSKGSLATDETSYDLGETITVSWTVPSAKADGSNWIGMYETGNDNKVYETWRNLTSESSGTVNFTASPAGTYEFRLFLNNSYNDIVTSKKIKVNRD